MDRGEGGERILVVDDDEHVLALCSAVLVGAGYIVIEANSGEEALRLLGEHHVDLVLMDVRLPGMSGFDTVAKMRSMPNLSGTPVVFLTVQSDADSRQRALDLGAADFLAKPLHRADLLVRVRPLLWARRLQREIGGLYDMVRAQRDGLLVARQKRADLMAFVVHDLSHPLSEISLSTTELEAEGLPQGAATPLGTIFVAVENMQRMLQNLRTISESDEAGLQLLSRPIDLAPLVEQAAGQAALRAKQLGHTLQISVTGAPLLVEADPAHTERVLHNLIDNALKYSPDGGVIHIEVLAVEQEVLVRIADSGPGIPIAERGHVFDRYYRLRRDREAHEREGTGLGLAFCKLVIDAHRGRIWVDEGEHGGARFCIALPLVIES